MNGRVLASARYDLAPPTVRAAELDCERTILQAAQIAGWRRHGEGIGFQRGRKRTPIKGDAGWPDLILAKSTWLLAVELKRKPNTVDDEQWKWLRALDGVPGVLALVVWVPEDQDDFIAALFGMPPLVDRWRV